MLYEYNYLKNKKNFVFKCIPVITTVRNMVEFFVELYELAHNQQNGTFISLLTLNKLKQKTFSNNGLRTNQRYFPENNPIFFIRSVDSFVTFYNSPFPIFFFSTEQNYSKLNKDLLYANQADIVSSPVCK